MGPSDRKFDVCVHGTYIEIMLAERLLVNGMFLARVVTHLNDTLSRRDDSIGIGTGLGFRLGIIIDRADEVLGREIGTGRFDLFHECDLTDPISDIPSIVEMSLRDGIAYADPEQALTVGQWGAHASAVSKRLSEPRHVGIGLYGNRLGYAAYDRIGKYRDPSFGIQLDRYFATAAAL